MGQGSGRPARSDGVDATLDQWNVAPGDQLPQFMEKSIRENSYVVIVCTPNYRAKSNDRKGGVGYEGDIMTAEVFAGANHRKFIPVLRRGDLTTAMPTWLSGKYGIDLRGEPHSDEKYRDLLNTLHKVREQAPPVGTMPLGLNPVRQSAPQIPVDPTKFEPIKIIGVVADEVGEPRDDGTRGLALYAVPFRLSRSAPHDWADLFVDTWRFPPEFTTMHRPLNIRIVGDRLILTETTIDEVQGVHRKTLKLVLDRVNERYAEVDRRRRAAEEAKAALQQQHREKARKLAEDMKFD